MLEKPRYIRGASVLISTKLSKFLFAQLAKYRILVRYHFKTIEDFAVSKVNISFLITDLRLYDTWNKYKKQLPSVKLLLINNRLANVELINKLGFIPILFDTMSVENIARQILNVFDVVNSGISEYELAFKDSIAENCRVVMPNKEYFVFTKLPNMGFVQYKGHVIKLSKLETVILGDLVYSYKWANGIKIRFDNLEYKQVTNTISRLRQKFRIIGLPLNITNNYGHGYLLRNKIV